MDRDCPLCHGEVEVLDRATWDLPGLPRTELGFGPCSACGLVLQSPCLEPSAVVAWYGASAVYTNPGRAGRPHPRKVRGTTRLLNAVEHALGRPARDVFQVGSSDGYALSRFREAGAERVRGLDPSEASCAAARERYGVEATVGTAEASVLPTSELALLTHVLEHLVDPLAVLARLFATTDTPWLAIEVPLFERPDGLPPGYLSFEHLTYFTEESLVRLLAAAGFEVVGLDKQYADDIYPVVAAVARRAEPVELPVEPGEAERSRTRLERYLERERGAWRSRAERLEAELDGVAGRLWLYGAGVFASQVLAHTGLGERHAIAGAIDSAPQKHGGALGPYPILSREAAALAPGDVVVVTSFASEEEIWRSLADERARAVRVLRLHSPTELPCA